MARPRTLPVTERRLPASRRLHRLSALAIARLMNREDARVITAVRRVLSDAARAAELIADALRRGGRIIYVGAGTSGRIAGLDAAELPPTFGIPERQVRILIAGGTRALARSVEGAEDDADDGKRRMRKLARPGDVVIAVAASGITPFTVAALREAARRGCTTVAVTAAPRSPLTRSASVAVAFDVGAELLTGSTRLKAGTATKIVLNMISTAAMVRLGRVWSNLMVDMPATNAKLRARAVRMVAEATGADQRHAARALRQAAGDARTAIVMLRRGLGRRAARELLARFGGDLDAALETARGSVARHPSPVARASRAKRYGY